MHSPSEHFREAIRAAGLQPPDVIEPGKFHKFPGEGKGNGNTAAWCKLFPDGIGGIYGDFSTGLSADWQTNRETPYTQAEREAYMCHVAEAKAQAEKEQAERHAEAASKALAIWDAAKPAPADHAYLRAKGIKSNGARLHGDALVIPLRDGGEIHSLQFTGPDGSKRFLTGGRVSGCYFSIGNPKGAAALCIAEGFATGATIHQATGYPVAVAFNAGNLGPVAKILRGKFPDLSLILCGDVDKSGTGQKAATEAAQAVGGIAALPDFTADELIGDKPPSDFNDLAQLRGADAVSRAVAGASAPGKAMHQAEPESLPAGEAAGPGVQEPDAPKETDAEIIRRLSAMSQLDYDRIRTAIAKRLGVRPATLDKMVGTERKGNSDDGMGFPDVEPWPSPVDPGALLSEISATVRRFIICQQETADAVGLWVAMTWVMDVVQIAPLAVITAPEKRCGKSQLLSLLSKLSYRPLTASNISPAALFRAVDAWKPTLLVDEADAFMRDNEELRGIINAGHTRDSAYVVRTVGDDFKPTRFSVWGAKALAGIGHLADTLMDRAIVLELRRKLSHENAERLRHAEPGLFDTLAEKLARFADDCRDDVRRARPDLPVSLNDRAQDNWEPLLAIADIAGGVWPVLGRNAALKLSGTDAPTMSTGTELLADIQEVFETAKAGRISTAQLIEALCSDDERPWATYNRGKPISPRQVAKRLNEYGISSTTIRVGTEVFKGFRRDMFEEAFSRYLVSPPPATVTPLQPSGGAGLHVTDDPQRYGNENQPVTRKPLQHKACNGVTDTGGVSGQVLEVEV